MINKDELYAAIDSRLKKNPRELIKFAQSKRGNNGKKYRFYSEMIYQEYKTRSATEIIKEIRDAGIIPPAEGQIWSLKNQVEKSIYDAKPLKAGDRKCWTEGCNKKIAEGNHAYCKDCQRRHNALPVDAQHGSANNCSF